MRLGGCSAGVQRSVLGWQNLWVWCIAHGVWLWALMSTTCEAALTWRPWNETESARSNPVVAFSRDGTGAEVRLNVAGFRVVAGHHKE